MSWEASREDRECSHFYVRWRDTMNPRTLTHMGTIAPPTRTSVSRTTRNRCAIATNEKTGTAAKDASFISASLQQ